MNMPFDGDFKITKLYGTAPPKGITYSAGKHAGIDLVGIDNKKIRAVMGGTVFRSGLDIDGWGKYIVIRQSDGRFAIYCHMANVFKASGTIVKAGEIIGIEGSTGKTTGNHLHFEIRKNYGDKYSTINPAEYLGIANKVGRVEVLEVEEEIKINVCGEIRKVKAILKDGNYRVKLQDLRCDKIDIGYSNNMPTVNVKN